MQKQNAIDVIIDCTSEIDFIAYTLSLSPRDQAAPAIPYSALVGLLGICEKLSSRLHAVSCALMEDRKEVEV